MTAEACGFPWFQSAPAPKVTSKHFCLIRSSKWADCFFENMKHPSLHIKEDRILGEDKLFCLLLLCDSFLRWSLTALSALVPTHHPRLVVHFRGVCFLSAWFSIPVSAQLCFLLWNHVYTVYSALMCFRELCSAAVVLTVHPHVNTPTFSRLWWETIGLGCLCVLPRVQVKLKLKIWLDHWHHKYPCHYFSFQIL